MKRASKGWTPDLESSPLFFLHLTVGLSKSSSNPPQLRNHNKPAPNRKCQAVRGCLYWGREVLFLVEESIYSYKRNVLHPLLIGIPLLQ